MVNGNRILIQISVWRTSSFDTPPVWALAFRQPVFVRTPARCRSFVCCAADSSRPGSARWARNVCNESSSSEKLTGATARGGPRSAGRGEPRVIAAPSRFRWHHFFQRSMCSATNCVTPRLAVFVTWVRIHSARSNPNCCSRRLRVVLHDLSIHLDVSRPDYFSIARHLPAQMRAEFFRCAADGIAAVLDDEFAHLG